MTDTMDVVIKRWTTAEEIRLRVGEIDPETMRTVLAVVKGMAREVAEINAKEINTATDLAYESGYNQAVADERIHS